MKYKTIMYYFPVIFSLYCTAFSINSILKENQTKLKKRERINGR